MRRHTSALMGGLLGAAAAINPTYAGVVPNGSLTWDVMLSGVDTSPPGCINATGCIAADTGAKTETTTTINAISGNLESAAAGVTVGSTVAFGPQPILVTPGSTSPISMTVVIGDVTFQLDSETTLAIIPTSNSVGGILGQTFTGEFLSDSSGTFMGLPQPVLLSEACSQANLAALIACSNTLQTPPLPTPEPASLALLGSALLGLGLFYRRRQGRGRLVDA